MQKSSTPRPITGNWQKGTFEGGELRQLFVYRLKFKIKAAGVQHKFVGVIRKQFKGWVMVRQDDKGDWLVKCEEDVIKYIDQLGKIAGVKSELHENQYQ